MTIGDALARAFASDDAVAIIGTSALSDSLVERVRGASRAFALVVLDHDVPALDRAMMLAAIAPLAIELGPERRIGALDVRQDASWDDILSAARFLAGAGSTTGQTLTVTALRQAGPPPRSQGPSDSSTNR